MFITMYTTARHRPLFGNQTIPVRTHSHTSLRSILILSYHLRFLFRLVSFLQDFQSKFRMIFLSFPTRVIWTYVTISNSVSYEKSHVFELGQNPTFGDNRCSRFHLFRNLSHWVNLLWPNKHIVSVRLITTLSSSQTAVCRIRHRDVH